MAFHFQRLLHLSVLGAATLSGLSAQPVTPAPKKSSPVDAVVAKKGSAADEEQVRKRALEFYGLVKDGKLLAAMEYVEKDSRDLFLAGEKPKPETLEVDRFEWIEGGTQAKVSIAGQTWMMVGGQKAASRVVFDSYWRRTGKQWLYFDPPVRERRTPFGVVKIGRDGQLVGTTVDLKSKVAEGARPEAIGAAIEVIANDIELSLSKPGTAECIVKNGVSGFINVIFGGANVKGLEFTPAESPVGPGETKVFTIKWTPGEQPTYGQNWGAVIVQPMNRRTQFKIRWVE